MPLSALALPSPKRSEFFVPLFNWLSLTVTDRFALQDSSPYAMDSGVLLLTDILVFNDYNSTSVYRLHSRPSRAHSVIKIRMTRGFGGKDVICLHKLGAKART